MKLVFILLLVVNLGFFAWEYPWAFQGKALYQQYFDHEEEPAMVLQRVDPGVKPLLMVGEAHLPQDKTPPPKAEAKTHAEEAPHKAEQHAEQHEEGPGLMEKLTAWWPFGDKEKAGHETTEIAPAQEMVLAPPMPVPSAPAEPHQAPPPAVEEPSVDCYTAGPFSSSRSATQAIAWLSERGYPASKRQELDKVPSGYWVHIPAPKTREEALQISQRLKRRGIDHFVLTKGDSKNAISLGIFSSNESAEQVKKSVTAKGFAGVRIDRKYNEVTQYWVDINDSKGKAVPASVFAGFTQQFKGTKQLPRECR